MVRKHLVVLLGQWLTRLPDRYDHEARLLPFLLNALNDPVQVGKTRNTSGRGFSELKDLPVSSTRHVAP